MWKAQPRDRILWVGEPRKYPRPIEQILGLVEFSEDALVARDNTKSISELNDYLDWASGSGEGEPLTKELVARVQHGLSVARRLGPPNSLSLVQWGIG